MATDEPRVVTALAMALKQSRERKGWTQRRLADEVTRAGHQVSGAYVGLIEAEHRIPTEAVVRALAGVLDCDEDELIKMRSHAAFDRILSGLKDKRMSDINPEARDWVGEFISRHGQTPLSALKRSDQALDAATAPPEELPRAADIASAWLSESGGPRRGRRYERATRLFELVADLDADEIQRVIGYTEAVLEDRKPPAGNVPH